MTETCSLCNMIDDDCHNCDYCDFTICSKCYDKHGDRILLVTSYVNECFVCYSNNCGQYIKKLQDEINELKKRNKRNKNII